MLELMGSGPNGLGLLDPANLDSARSFLNAGRHGARMHWAVVDANETIVGYVSLTRDDRHQVAELSYAIGRHYQRRGYATEAAKLALRIAFRDLGLPRVFARCTSGNPASRRVLEKIGMKLEGTLRDHWLYEGRRYDQLLFGILRPECAWL